MNGLMKRSVNIKLRCFVFALFWASVCKQDCEASQPESNQPKHIIVVSLDGLAAYLFDDTQASLPTVRELAANGSIATGGMKVSNPSVTWPNHTSMISGVRPEKHGVLANGVLVRSGPGVPVYVDPKRDWRDLVRIKTVVDLAHEQGLRTGEVNWPCTRNSPSFDDSIPDVPDALQYTTSRFANDLLELGHLKKDEEKLVYSRTSAAAKDWIWTQAACHLIRNRKPNLLLVHLLNVDSTHHASGAQTAAGYTANAYIDLCLQQIVRSADEAGILDETVFMIVSDHGFITTPQVIKPHVALREAGLLKDQSGKIVEATVHVVPEGGIGLVYCTNPLDAKKLRREIENALVGREGVEGLLFPEQYADYGLPMPREYDQAPDAVLVAKEGYSVSANVVGNAFVETNTQVNASLGSHGYLSTNSKMNGLCILSGKGIRKGVELNDVENISVAGTIAHLLGLKDYEGDGRPLTSALLDAK